MGKFWKAITAAGATVVMFAAILAVSAQFAHAQDFNPGNGSGAHGNRGQMASQPESSTPSFDFSGCWDGTSSDLDVYDQWVGYGIGWIGIDQKKANIKGGKHGSYYEFVWDNGDYAYGTLSGKADSDGFAATGAAGGKCRVGIVASPDGNEIDGVYGFYSCGSFDYHSGYFYFTADPGGCVDIIP